MTRGKRASTLALRGHLARASCGDVAADLISEPSTGTNLDIAATDQIRPIARDLIALPYPIGEPC